MRLALIERSFRIRGEVVPEGVGVESKGGGGAPPLPWGRVIDKRALARRFQLVETESSLSASRVGEKNKRSAISQIRKRKRAVERKETNPYMPAGASPPAAIFLLHSAHKCAIMKTILTHLIFPAGGAPCAFTTSP